MTRDEQDLARQLAAHPRWRWTDGMEAAWPEASIGRRYSESDRWYPDDGRVPNLADPATVGCLIAMLYGLDPYAYPYRVKTTWFVAVDDGDPYGATLGEALGRALLAAWGER